MQKKRERYWGFFFFRVFGFFSRFFIHLNRTTVQDPLLRVLCNQAIRNVYDYFIVPLNMYIYYAHTHTLIYINWQKLWFRYHDGWWRWRLYLSKIKRIRKKNADHQEKEGQQMRCVHTHTHTKPNTHTQSINTLCFIFIYSCPSHKVAKQKLCPLMLKCMNTCNFEWFQ